MTFNNRLSFYFIPKLSKAREKVLMALFALTRRKINGLFLVDAAGKVVVKVSIGKHRYQQKSIKCSYYKENNTRKEGGIDFV